MRFSPGFIANKSYDKDDINDSKKKEKEKRTTYCWKIMACFKEYQRKAPFMMVIKAVILY